MTITQVKLFAGTLALILLTTAVCWSAPLQRCKGMMIAYSEYRTDLSTGDACEASTLPCVVNADGTGRRILARELKKDEYTAVYFQGWSVDGQSAKLVVLRKGPEVTKWEEEHKTYKPGVKSKRYLLDLATGKTSLPPPAGPNVSVHGYNLSPDRKSICYANGDLCIASPDGSNAKHVSTGNPFNFIPKWSPNGQWIALVSGVHLGNSDIYVVRRDGTDLRKLASRNGYWAATSRWDIFHFHNSDSDFFDWSPDGKWIYYSARFGQAADLMRANLDGKIERLTHSDESVMFQHPVLRPGGPTQTGIRNSHPSLSPDGKWLAFTSTRTGKRQIYVMPSSGGKAYQITDVGSGWGTRHAHWRPIPSGKKFAMETREQHAHAETLEAPNICTRSPSTLGSTGMTFNGSIHPHGLYTEYYFEYGPTVSYGQKTSAKPLPPRLAAYYEESWDQGHGGWKSGLFGNESTHHTQGGAVGGFVRASEPDQDDENHNDGVGTLHLPLVLFAGPLNDPPAYLGGGDPDLRGAQVSLCVRGNNWVANGSELVWWTQSQINIEIGSQHPGFRRANWAYTGFSLNDFLRSGQWKKTEFQLLHDAEMWSYGGNNLNQVTPKHFSRYSYWPIDEAQQHVNVDFILALAFVDPENPPTGAIDFDEFKLVYRNHSLLLPSNGGELIQSPPTAPGDPGPDTMTNGWRHGTGRMWRSVKDSVGPLDFIYRFTTPVVINTVQLHQNPDWPAKNVQVLVSSDGVSYTPLLEKVLPEKGVPNVNFAFTVDASLSAEAQYLKVRILSGYERSHWGLGEIEVFGTGAVKLPDDDLYFVNTDIDDLSPGTTYHYRLVTISAAGTVHGNNQTFTIPTDNSPQVFTGAASRITTTTTKVEGRLNPMGLCTHFYFEFGPDTNYGSRSPVTYGGLQITPRTALTTLTGLKPNTIYHYRLVATNDIGVGYGDDATLHTAPAK